MIDPLDFAANDYSTSAGTTWSFKDHERNLKENYPASCFEHCEPQIALIAQVKSH